MKRYAALVFSILFLCSLGYAEGRERPRKITNMTPTGFYAELTPLSVLKSSPETTKEMVRQKCRLRSKRMRRRISHWIYTFRKFDGCNESYDGENYLNYMLGEYGYEYTKVIPAGESLVYEVEPMIHRSIECVAVSKRGRISRSLDFGAFSNRSQLFIQKYSTEPFPDSKSLLCGLEL